MRAALIAAGKGERLRAGGLLQPKPLVPIAGVPLIDRVLGAVVEAGLSEVACIFNEEADAVEAHCRAHSHGLRLRIVRRTTPSSMESLFTLAPLLVGERFLLLTVDALFGPGVLSEFLRVAEERSGMDGILAVTDFVDDEKPLRVAVGPGSKITAIGPEAADSALVTAGFYVFDPRIFDEMQAARDAGYDALRQFLGHLVRHEYRMGAVCVGQTVDVDRPEDIAVAEAFARRELRG